ncbi:hypothetical protein H310_02932 [Aphanomyces invadans]|uniref:Uncharacterized protein n=1 Tax=Aphanomyces invadans TaxID=157072 RepID=A0A024UKE0_9STRA|nr:hypothetical protein H310_02932 [Aphanomyces invadans]ETW06774.1 hypothetical protein H310_02932 [Aphanomyces invadans]|eukprot:XP_008864849.1 hypothetical protein H310_02932 [Aphanomyces invadans]
MPKKVAFRPIQQPSFGLISESSRVEHVVRQASGPPPSTLSPHRRLRTDLGQRFVRMMATLTALAHSHLRDDTTMPTIDVPPVQLAPHTNAPPPRRMRDATPSCTKECTPTDKPLQPEASAAAVDQVHDEGRGPPVPALVLASTSTKKRRRKRRVKRTWKTSHATWCPSQADANNISAYNRESELRKLELLHTLSTLQHPSLLRSSSRASVRGASTRSKSSYTTITCPHDDGMYADDTLSQPSDCMASIEGSRQEPLDGPPPSPQPKTITIEIRLKLDPPRPPSPPTASNSSLQRTQQTKTASTSPPSSVASASSPSLRPVESTTLDQAPSPNAPTLPAPKLHRHTPTVITREMAAWLRQHGLFKVKPRHELQLTMADQLPLHAS